VVRRIAFSHRGDKLATAGYDGTVRLWTRQGNELCVIHVDAGSETRPQRVYYALFGPDDQWLLSASDDSRAPLRLWDISACTAGQCDCPEASAAPSYDPSVGSLTAVTLAVAEERSLLAVGTKDGQVQIWELTEPDRWQSTCTRTLHKASVNDVQLSSDLRHLVSAGKDGRAALLPIDAGGCGPPTYLRSPWQSQPGGEPVAHDRLIYSVGFSPDSLSVVTASQDNTAIIWDLKGQRPRLLRGHQDRIYYTEFSPDGRWVLTASRDGKVMLWEADGADPRGFERPYLVLEANLGGVAYAGFSPDGNYVAAAYWDNAAKLWQVEAEESEPALLRHLTQKWGPVRARLAVIQEAEKFRVRNGLDRWPVEVAELEE
jgi:WD40 repeat protein